jgi:hypothetical protein
MWRPVAGKYEAVGSQCSWFLPERVMGFEWVKDALSAIATVLTAIGQRRYRETRFRLSGFMGSGAVTTRNFGS